MMSCNPYRPAFCSPHTGTCPRYACTAEVKYLSSSFLHAPAGPAASCITTMGNASSGIDDLDWQWGNFTESLDLPQTQAASCRGAWNFAGDGKTHQTQPNSYELDVMMDDADVSRAGTQPANSYNSASTPPPSIEHPVCQIGPGTETGEMSAANNDPLHTIAMESGGLGMNDLKDAMTQESNATEPLVDIIGLLLDKTVQRNDALMRTSMLHDFESERMCALTASEYLSRMMRYGKCSPCCAVVGLIYLQRVKARVPSACITSRNMQRLLLTAVMLANKFLDDLYFSNKHWAKIGGIV